MSLLNLAQIILSILLVASVLFQQRGAGLSPVFGGSSGAYRTRRGIEKTVFTATIVLSILFLATALLNFVLR